ncbi:ABC transporter ATP-binding protein [Flavobacterium sp. JP2137]|uniref:ABC transporter ATP-binding protein n=1 Tax=Flavobacterium sp. JP2137 TaxID=3414510 RepID=UPI003D2FD10E
MIHVRDLSKVYNGNTVLSIDSLHIKKGECFGLVGNNGAGKTTFFSLLLDLIQPTTGGLVNGGFAVSETEAWKPFTAAFIDESFLIGYLTPEEYFYFIGALRGLNKEQLENALLEYVDFFNGEILSSGKYLRDFSKGNQKKVGIAAAFLGNPKLVVLDEPFANLDPSTQIRLKKLMIKKTVTQELTMLISSHDLQHTVEVSTRIVALEKGRLVKDVQTSENTLSELQAFFAV